MDTNVLLRLQEKAFEEPFLVSSITFMELEEIKSSGKKDEGTKYQARNLLRLFEANEDAYTLDVVTQHNYDILDDLGLPVSNDNLIIAGAFSCMDEGIGEDDASDAELSAEEIFEVAKVHDENITFVTDDIAARRIAEVVGLETEVIEDTDGDRYTGYVSVKMNEEQMGDFYGHLNENPFELLTNQYLRVLDASGKLVDTRRWNGSKFVPLYDKGIKSVAFGAKLKTRDEFQAMAVDSIMNNTMTIISGKAGSGKSLMALASIFYLIENGKYSRVIILANPCKVRGATDLGFYQGSAVEKLMQNSIGNVLTTKFGDRYIVDQMLNQEKMKIISIADSRGMEVRDDEILYATENQNCSIDMMKLMLSRASQGCKVVLEGDFDTQVDSWAYEGRNNGMKRAVDVFRGNELFGFVELPNVWRSKLAELAQKL